MKRKVVAVWGSFESKDFVLEPYEKGDEKDLETFWIEKVEEPKQEYNMGDEKIEQNIDRTYNFIFHTLGCSQADAEKILEGVLRKLIIGKEIN